MLKIKIRIFLDGAEITESKFRNCPRIITPAPPVAVPPAPPVAVPPAPRAAARAPLAAAAAGEDRPEAMWVWIALGLGCTLITL